MHHIQDRWSWTTDVLQSLMLDEQVYIIKEIDLYVHWLVEKTNDVQGKRYSKNAALTEEGPPGMPNQVVCKHIGFQSPML